MKADAEEADLGPSLTPALCSSLTNKVALPLLGRHGTAVPCLLAFHSPNCCTKSNPACSVKEPASVHFLTRGTFVVNCLVVEMSG